MPYITSTMSASVSYAIYGKTAGGLPIVQKEIVIEGGANVMSKKLMVTPNGVVTKVTDEELALLEAHPLFKTHQKNGFIRVSKSNPQEDIAKVDTKDMQNKDASAQRVDSDYTKKGKKAPKVK